MKKIAIFLILLSSVAHAQNNLQTNNYGVAIKPLNFGPSSDRNEPNVINIFSAIGYYDSDSFSNVLTPRRTFSSGEDMFDLKIGSHQLPIVNSALNIAGTGYVLSDDVTSWYKSSIFLANDAESKNLSSYSEPSFLITQGFPVSTIATDAVQSQYLSQNIQFPSDITSGYLLNANLSSFLFATNTGTAAISYDPYGILPYVSNDFSDVKLKNDEKDSKSIFYSGFISRSETIYNSNHQISGFEFSDNELQNDNGFTLALSKIWVSSSIDPEFSAAYGNGAYIAQQAVFKVDWLGSDGFVWASLEAPSPLQKTSFTLFPSANVSSDNEDGAFVINTGKGNNFSFGTNSSGGRIGWDNYIGTTITVDASVIKTSAEFISNAVIKSNSLAVYDGDWNNLAIPVSTQAYFATYNPNNSGITVENLSTESTSSSKIILKHGNVENWIGTSSVNSNSDLYRSGSLVLESYRGMLFFNHSDNDENYASFRFVINSVEIARITDNGILLRGHTTQYIRQIEYPSEGQLVYNTNKNELCFFNGTEWRIVRSEPMN